MKIKLRRTEIKVKLSRLVKKIGYRMIRIIKTVKSVFFLLKTLETLERMVETTEVGIAQLFVSLNHLQNNIGEIERELGVTTTPLNINKLPTRQDLKGQY